MRRNDNINYWNAAALQAAFSIFDLTYDKLTYSQLVIGSHTALPRSAVAPTALNAVSNRPVINFFILFP